MEKWENTAWNNQTGLPVANPTVTVYHVGTLVTATIYADEGVTTKANPFTGDTQGRFWFYAPDGDYDVRVEGAGITAYVLTDVTLGDKKRATGLTEYEVYLLANAFYHRQGAEWRRRDTGRPAWAVLQDADTGDDFLRVLRVAPGANPITWTPLCTIDASGRLRLGADPSHVLDAATKQYVDASAASKTRALYLAVPGAVVEGAGASMSVPSPIAGTITAIKSTCRVAASTTYTFDIHKGGTTIYTTQGNRPQRTSGNGTGLVTHTAPDVTIIAADDLFTVDVDTAGADLEDVLFVIYFTEA